MWDAKFSLYTKLCANTWNNNQATCMSDKLNYKKAATVILP